MDLSIFLQLPAQLRGAGWVGMEARQGLLSEDFSPAEGPASVLLNLVSELLSGLD